MVGELMVDGQRRRGFRLQPSQFLFIIHNSSFMLFWSGPGAPARGGPRQRPGGYSRAGDAPAGASWPAALGGDIHFLKDTTYSKHFQ